MSKLEQIRSKFEDARQCTCCSTDIRSDEREIQKATGAMFALIEAGLSEADQLRARITELEGALDRCIDALADARSARIGGLFPDDIAERDAYRAILERGS